MYIYNMSILVKTEEEENLALEYELDDAVEAVLRGKDAEYVSASVEEVCGQNYGVCAKCGAWVSDASKDDHIAAFSDGTKIGEEWYCDICLPNDYPDHF